MSFETIAIIFTAISLGSFSKGMTGIGLPLIGIPIMAGFLGVEHAVVVLSIPVWVSNVYIVWSYRRIATAIPVLWVSLGCASVGTVIGAYGLATLDDRVLLYILAAWIAAYLVNLALNPDFKLEGRAARYGSPMLAVVAGLSQGSTGMSGPVIATWIHSFRLRNEAYVFGVSVMFLAISTTQVVAVSTFGLMDQERMIQGLLALIPTMLFTPLGMRTTRLISQKLFSRLIVGLVMIMEAKLAWQIVAGW